MKKSVVVSSPFVLSVIAFLCYLPSLYYAFQFDDLANIVKFYDIRHKTIRELFFSSTRWISYWMNTLYYSISKFDPFYYRLGNVIFHCVTGFIAYWVIYTALTGLKKKNFFTEYAFEIAFCTAGLFLLHPVQTQTVSYVIQGQLEGLAGLFIFSNALCFLYMCRAQGTKRRALFGLLCALSILACGTKEISIVTPALLLIIDWFFVAQGDIKSLKSRWRIHATIWCVVGSIYIYFLKPQYFARVFGLAIETRNNIGNVLTQDPHAKITSTWYCISQFKVIVHYMAIFLWPFNMSADYDWILVDNFFASDCIVPFLILCAIALYIYKRLYNNSIDLVAFGFLWFFATLLPRSSIIPSTELVADYKTYGASLGLLFVMAAALLYAIKYLYCVCMRQKNIRFAEQMALACCVLCFWGALTIKRNKVWRSGEEFWWNVIQNAPNKARAYNNYGVSLSEKGKYADAISFFKKAISMDRYYPDPCNNIAVAYSAVGNLDEAIKSIKAGIAIQPYYPEGYNNLASFLLQKQKYDEAEAALHKAISLRPHYGKAYFNLGRLYLEINKKEEAFNSFKSCCMKADFDNEVGFSSYGMISLMLNRGEDALFAYKRLLEFVPDNFSYRFNYANAHYINKDFKQAVALYKVLLAENPRDGKLLFNAGEAYFALEDYKTALHCFNESHKYTDELPQYRLRMADCHLKLGNKPQAKTELTHLIASNNAPLGLKKHAQQFLAQLNTVNVEKSHAA